MHYPIYIVVFLQATNHSFSAAHLEVTSLQQHGCNHLVVHSEEDSEV